MNNSQWNLLGKFFAGALITGCLGYSYAGPVQCKKLDGSEVSIEPKTITIKNNSSVPIYPALVTSSNEVNEWIQGCFRTNAPHPTKKVYKVYINDKSGGLAVGQSVTFTLPLYSEISGGEDQYITWWNGGRVLIADKNDRLDLIRAKDQLIPTPQGLESKCEGGSNCDVAVYSSKTQFPDNTPAQLTEYTFGGVNPPPGESLKLLNPDNVGYNISYVDHVYLPIAMGPKGNPYIGYSGSAKDLNDFRNILQKFLEPNSIGDGWPIYNMFELKIPGGYNVFAQRADRLEDEGTFPVMPVKGNPYALTILKCKEGQCDQKEKDKIRFGAAVQNMQTLWASCVPEFYSDLSNKTIPCSIEMKQDLTDIHNFFLANYENYNPSDPKKPRLCEPLKANPELIKPKTSFEFIKHIYGWVPFNEGCGAGANALGDSSLHAKMQKIYILNLQYNYEKNLPKEFLFNPYVELIHSPEYLDMDAYGFSVDDAVGFMSELGKGLIITVGGTEGLENTQKFSYKTGFTVIAGVPQGLNPQDPVIKSYGVEKCPDATCAIEVNQIMKMPENSLIPGFRVGTVADYPIKIAFTDVKGNVYSFIVKENFQKFPENKADMLGDCKVTGPNISQEESRAWCSVNPNQAVEKQVTQNFLSFPPLLLK